MVGEVLGLYNKSFDVFYNVKCFKVFNFWLNILDDILKICYLIILIGFCRFDIFYYYKLNFKVLILYSYKYY